MEKSLVVQWEAIRREFEICSMNANYFPLYSFYSLQTWMITGVRVGGVGSAQIPLMLIILLFGQFNTWKTVSESYILSGSMTSCKLYISGRWSAQVWQRHDAAPTQRLISHLGPNQLSRQLTSYTPLTIISLGALRSRRRVWRTIRTPFEGRAVSRGCSVGEPNSIPLSGEWIVFS